MSGRSSSCVSDNRSSIASQEDISSGEPLSTQSSCISTATRFKALSEKPSEAETSIKDGKVNFTLSGSETTKIVGPVSKFRSVFAKHAPCEQWISFSSEKERRKSKEKIEARERGPSKAPYGMYGPWNKNGPAAFLSPKIDYLKQVFPPTTKRRRNGSCTSQPMGKQAPWSMSGSCRYAGRPYGPCRPCGAFQSRGPFGFWNCSFPQNLRPPTPCQPCWRPNKRGCRPCTPCHRPLFRPCKHCER